MFLSYLRRMDLCRDQLILMIREALMRHPGFRPRRRDWAATRDRDAAMAHGCAAEIVDHLQRCGVEWSRRQPLPPHSAGE
jgi:hypothetical protein